MCTLADSVRRWCRVNEMSFLRLSKGWPCADSQAVKVIVWGFVAWSSLDARVLLVSASVGRN
jgi:hypothetical protein